MSASDEAITIANEALERSRQHIERIAALESENAELPFAITAEVMRFAGVHRVEDFDAPINWLTRCVLDARQSILAKRSKQNGK